MSTYDKSVFDVYGPFEIKRDRENRILPHDQYDTIFWNETVKEKYAEEDLYNAIGCYVFAIRAGGDIKPWYIGKTIGQSFGKRIFQQDRFKMITSMLKQTNAGTPLVFLLPLLTKSGDKFSKKITGEWKNTYSKFVDDLEKILINRGCLINPELLNTSNTEAIRKIEIRGCVNSDIAGRADEYRQFKNIFNFDKHWKK